MNRAGPAYHARTVESILFVVFSFEAREPMRPMITIGKLQAHAARAAKMLWNVAP